MQLSFTSLITLILCLALNSAYAGPLEDGHTAFDQQQYKKAYDLWLPLAEQGNADAQYNIGLLYMKGHGVELDERTALVWFTLAGEQGVADAQYNAGVLFYTGKGVYPDHNSAIDWWTLAVDAGHANAQNNLAIMYAYGYSVGQDTKLALELWTAAANQGHPDAIHSLINAYAGNIVGFEKNEALAEQWRSKK